MRKVPRRQRRALRAALEEARRHPLPVRQDPQLEERLMASIARQPRPRHAGPPRRAVGWLVPGFASAALAAGVAFWLWASPESPRLEPPSLALAPGADIDGDRLSSAQIVRAPEAPIEVTHDGRATWVLEAGGEATVLESGARIRVRLLRGALRARVDPGDVSDRFVVEAAQTRVAVRGTIFRVAIEGDENLVEVERGAVAVGPLDAPEASHVLLRAPAQGRFDSTGRPCASPHAAPSATSSGVARHPGPDARAARGQPEAAPSAAASSAASPRDLTVSEVEEGVATVVQAVSRCFEEHTALTPNVRVRVRTSMTLDVDPDGSVRDVRFDPPLAPALHACSDQDARAARFAPSQNGATVTRVIELSR